MDLSCSELGRKYWCGTSCKTAGLLGGVRSQEYIGLCNTPLQEALLLLQECHIAHLKGWSAGRC